MYVPFRDAFVCAAFAFSESMSRCLFYSRKDTAVGRFVNDSSYNYYIYPNGGH